jgi:amino acid adenylation domain-containing protein
MNTVSRPPAPGSALVAALALLAFRRFPVERTAVRLGCGCGWSGTLALHRTLPATELLRLAGTLDHACGRELTAALDGLPGSTLRLRPDGRLVEPTGDTRWRTEDALRILTDTVRELSDTVREDPAPTISQIPRTAGTRQPGGSAPGEPAGPTVHAAFRRQALREPDRIAVHHGDTATTYREILHRAEQVALALAAEPAPGPVVVEVAAGADEVAVLLGIMASGRAYLPVDHRSPDERVQRLAEIAGPALLVADRDRGLGIPHRTPARLYAGGPGAADWSAGDPRQAAYVMFTSGSTGRPKGVVVPHEAVLRLAAAGLLDPAGKRGRFLRAASAAFDASTFELWVPLLHGGCVVPLSEGALSDPELLAAALAGGAVDTMWLTSGLFQQLVDLDPAVFGPVRRIFTGGDVVPPRTVARALAARPGLAIVNGYGPTENTTFSTTLEVTDPARVEGRDRLPIGRPLEGDHAWVADQSGRPVPPGLAGELIVAGPGVALGYVGGSAEQDGRFRPVEVGGRRLRSYRTGDQVALLADGSLDFLGRMDGQVKHRGFRIEYGEVEAGLRAVPGVRHAAAALDRREGGTALVALAVVEPGSPATVADIGAAVRLALPDYLCPDRLALVERLPLTEGGKLDRAAVVRIGLGSGAGEPAGDAVRLAVQAVLGHGGFGEEQNLLTCGLHSLGAVRLLRELRARTGSGIQLSDILTDCTVAGLRAAVGRTTAAPVPIGTAG